MPSTNVKCEDATPAPACPECGAMQMNYTVEDYQTEDGLTIRRLRHLKCSACAARFFDDEAMHRIQKERANLSLEHAV